MKRKYHVHETIEQRLSAYNRSFIHFIQKWNMRRYKLSETLIVRRNLFRICKLDHNSMLNFKTIRHHKKELKNLKKKTRNEKRKEICWKFKYKFKLLLLMLNPISIQMRKYEKERKNMNESLLESKKLFLNNMVIMQNRSRLLCKIKMEFCRERLLHVENLIATSFTQHLQNQTPKGNIKFWTENLSLRQDVWVKIVENCVRGGWFRGDVTWKECWFEHKSLWKYGNKT